MIGRTISRYEIVDKLGEGGMGVVYRARDTRLGRLVALKFLGPHAIGSPDKKELFIKEARAAAALDHPNICTIHEIDERDGLLFIAMALIEGETLREKICRGPLGLDETLQIAVQVARGLAAAHSRGIVHRDVKSGNIMIATDGRALILDFGLAQCGPGDDISEAATLAGTPAVMSPEQLRNDPLDARTDVWSFGALLYEMLTGRMPFQRRNVAAVIHAVLSEPHEPVTAARPDVAAWLDRLIDRSLSKRRENRYRDAGELLIALEAGDADEPAALRTRFAADRPELPSVGVLAFSDMSAERDQEYFCDGIAEEIINRLAHVERVRVASRTSTFAYKNRIGDIREIGQRLGVQAVLEGSVRKSGAKLRITCQLIDVPSGYHLWSEQFDRELEDVFAIQEEIAQRVVRALRIELSEKERHAIQKSATRDVEAFDYYLKGRQFFYRSRRKNLDYALEMFSRAVEKDPRFARAHAGMADCYCYLHMYFGGDPGELARAETSARRALQIDPALADARAAHGLVLTLSRRYAEAEQEFESAIRLNPELFEAYYFYARLCFTQGRLDEAVRLYARASETDPADIQALSLLAFTYTSLGEHEKAAAAYRDSLERTRRHLELNPDDARAHYLAATAFLALGQQDECWRAAERAESIDSADAYIVYGLACLYSRAGRCDQAIERFAAAVDAGFVHVEWIERDTDLDSIRADPRFEAIVNRLRAGVGGQDEWPNLTSDKPSG